MIGAHDSARRPLLRGHIIVIRGGKFIGLEVKRPGGRKSDDQKAFEVRSREAGAIHAVVQRIEDVQRMGL
jgi:hypothetical protein